MKYWSQRQALNAGVQKQDKEFREFVESSAQSLTLPRFAEGRRIEVARSVLGNCLGKSPGIVITLSTSGYNYSSLGGGHGNSGGPPAPRPSPDEMEAYKAFSKFKFSPEATKQCEVLRSRADILFENATELSTQALSLAEQTTLTGDCGYVRLEN